MIGAMINKSAMIFNLLVPVDKKAVNFLMKKLHQWHVTMEKIANFVKKSR